MRIRLTKGFDHFCYLLGQIFEQNLSPLRHLNYANHWFATVLRFMQAQFYQCWCEDYSIWLFVGSLISISFIQNRRYNAKIDLGKLLNRLLCENKELKEEALNSEKRETLMLNRKSLQHISSEYENVDHGRKGSYLSLRPRQREKSCGLLVSRGMRAKHFFNITSDFATEIRESLQQILLVIRST